MRVICVHPRFAGYTSHHYNESYGFIQEYARRGREFVLLIAKNAEPRIVRELNARPVIDDPTFRREWSFEERSRRFVEMLRAEVEPLVRADDLVMVTVATQLEAHALTRWTQMLPDDRKPWVLVVFISDRWNRSGPAEYERQRAEMRTLEAEIASLSPANAHRMIFTTVTESLGAELTELLGTKVAATAMPLDYGVVRPPRPPAHPPRVGILGGLRREKGSYLIHDIVRACRKHVNVSFLVHLLNNNLSADEVKRVSRVAKERHVTVIRDAVPLPEYESALDSIDLGVFPYEVIPYRQRTSGVFGESVAYGKPVVATRGTWMAQQIEAGRAAGVIFDELEPEAIARAVAHCVAELEPLTRTARAISDDWRRTVSLSAFVDFVEREIAARATSGRGRDARPPEKMTTTV